MRKRSMGLPQHREMTPRRMPRHAACWPGLASGTTPEHSSVTVKCQMELRGLYDYGRTHIAVGGWRVEWRD
jgi:hypothetical protein